MKTRDTREDLITSATEVFIKEGFSGARVDEIARQAKTNKAMIYYHFGSKEKLYKAVLMRHIGGIHEEIARLAREETEPLARLLAFYAAYGRTFQGRPALPFLMFREILTGGVHMDADVARALTGVLDFVRATIGAGIRQGCMRPVNPVFVHLSVIAPMMVFCVSRPFRERLLPVASAEASAPTAEGFFAYLQEVLTRALQPGLDAPTNRS
jgi:AcrR family transcriptional regulator